MNGQILNKRMIECLGFAKRVFGFLVLGDIAGNAESSDYLTGFVAEGQFGG